MILVEAFLSWISQAVLFGRSILSKLFSNSLTVGFLPIFIAVVILGAFVAYIIRPFLAVGSSDMAWDNYSAIRRSRSHRAEYLRSKYRRNEK